MKTLIIVVLLLGSAFAQLKDGPATLPIRTMTTSMASTPAPNPPKIIGPTDNLQVALNNAVCGDNFQIDPQFEGTITSFPLLACDDSHWIWIASSGTLPAEGVRIKPGTMMPKLIVKGSNGTIKGGVKIRVIGIEITRLIGSGLVYNLVTPGVGAHDIIFDRDYIHGTPIDETVRGLFISNVSNVGVVDSYFSDFHCAAPGFCSDSQAIAGGLDSIQSGNYLIKNNYLEASAEIILFGGGGALFVPTDITIIGNELRKPDSWNPDDPSYSPVNGKPWSVKNHFELKSGKRVLFEKNTLSGNWGGFTQTGFSILLTPKNQNGQCPICVVEDVTIRYNRITKSGQALQLGIYPSGTGDWPSAGDNWSIHGNSFDHLGYKTCHQCGRWAVQLASSVTPSGSVLHDVLLDRNTFLVDGYPAPGGFLLLGGPVTPPLISNIQYTNNVEYAGSLPIYSTGGGATNCASVHLFKPDIISACWSGTSAFMGNVILYSGIVPRGIPSGNIVVDAGANVTQLP